MVRCSVTLFALLVAACERTPNYHAGVPGGSGHPSPPSISESSERAGPSGSSEAATGAAAADLSSPQGGRGSLDGGSAGGRVAEGARSGVAGESMPAVPPQGADSQRPGFDDTRPIATHEQLRAHARDRRFDQLRAISERFRKLRAELQALGARLVVGDGTDADKARYMALEKESMEVEMPRILEYMQDPKWTQADRAAMTLIIYNAEG